MEDATLNSFDCLLRKASFTPHIGVRPDRICGLAESADTKACDDAFGRFQIINQSDTEVTEDVEIQGTEMRDDHRQRSLLRQVTGCKQTAGMMQQAGQGAAAFLYTKMLDRTTTVVRTGIKMSFRMV